MALNWDNIKRTGAKMGGAMLGGYATGDYAGALSAGLAEAANGGFDNSRGYNFLRDTAAPTSLGYLAGKSDTGKGFNKGIDNVMNKSRGFNPLARLASAGYAGGTDAIKGFNSDGGIASFMDTTADGGYNSSLADALFAKDMKGRLVRGTLGGAIASMTAPKMPNQAVTTRAQLDAMTLPDMERANADRIAMANAELAAKGGVGSADLYRMQLARDSNNRELARQRVINQVNADTSQNAATQAAYLAAVRRQQDILSGALTGFDLGQPLGKDGKPAKEAVTYF